MTYKKSTVREKVILSINLWDKTPNWAPRQRTWRTYIIKSCITEMEMGRTCTKEKRRSMGRGSWNGDLDKQKEALPDLQEDGTMISNKLLTDWII